MIDTARIVVKSGNGGAGAVSFRREKYVPMGGPDGGDGGDGGNVILSAQSGQHMLRSFRYKRSFHAEDGERGRGNDKMGRRGKDYVIEVPVGTLVTRVYKDESRMVIDDLTESGVRTLVAEGGWGGKGNARFAHAQNRSPILAEDGDITEERVLELELQVLADIAILGMPSVGKSSLLRVCSRARPDVAAYPFTTLEPVLGFVERRSFEFTLVEIPGLVEGAHRGVGLGFDFLRHAQRVSAVIHILDGSSGDPIGNYLQIREEMRLHDDSLAGKPEIVAVNKQDMPEAQSRRHDIERSLGERGINALFISAATSEGVEELLERAAALLVSRSSPAHGRVEPIAVPEPRAARERVSVERDMEAFVVRSPRAERIVRRVNLEDWTVQAQLWAELRNMGIVRALQRAGAKNGSTVRIGEWELEWK